MGKCWRQLESKPKKPDNYVACYQRPGYTAKTKFFCWSCKITVSAKKSSRTGNYIRPSRCVGCGLPGGKMLRLRGEE